MDLDKALVPGHLPKNVERSLIQALSRPTFFFTDDNFPRNPRWREILEALAPLFNPEGRNLPN